MNAVEFVYSVKTKRRLNSHEMYSSSFDKIDVIIVCCENIIRSLPRFLQVAKCNFSCCVTMSTSTHILPLSSLRWKVLHFLLSTLSKFDGYFLHWQIFSSLSPERNHVTESHGKYLSSAETPARWRGLAEERGRVSWVRCIITYLFWLP